MKIEIGFFWIIIFYLAAYKVNGWSGVYHALLLTAVYMLVIYPILSFTFGAVRKIKK